LVAGRVPGDQPTSPASTYVCKRCGGGQQLGHGVLVPVAEEIVRMAQCDAQHVGEIADVEGSTAASNDNRPLERQRTEAAPRDSSIRAQDGMSRQTELPT